MSAYRTSEQWAEKTPQEALGGGIIDPNRPDDAEGVAMSTVRTRRAHPVSLPRASRSGGRGGVQRSDSDLDPHWTVVGRLPFSLEQAITNHEGNMVSKAAGRAYKLATESPDTGYAYPDNVDKTRRDALVWAALLLSEAAQADGASNVMREPEHEAYLEVSRYYRDAEQAAELADSRRQMSVELVASACRKCYFYEDCVYRGQPEQLVADLSDREVRRGYVEEISGPAVKPENFVSCESAVRRATKS